MIKLNIDGDDAMKVTADNGNYESNICLPLHPFAIRDELDKLRADGDTALDIKIIGCKEVKALEGMSLKADLYKLNVLAQRLEQLDCEKSMQNIGIAALLQVKPYRSIDELIRMTYSDSISVNPCSSYEELGEMVIENDLLSELEDVPDNILPMIDKLWVGRTFSEREHGVFVNGFYCLPEEYEEPQIDIEVGRRDDVFFSLLLVPPTKDPDIYGQRFELPVFDNKLDEFSKEYGVPLDKMNYYSLESAVPLIFEPKNIEKLNNLAADLYTLENNEIIKLKAVLQTLPAQTVSQVHEIVNDLDDYELDRRIRSYDDFGQEYLQRLLPPEFSARALEDTDLTDLGCNVLYMKRGTITSYGALSGKGEHLYTPIVDNWQEEAEDENESEHEDISMGGMT